jgi:hypothetical protein
MARQPVSIPNTMAINWHPVPVTYDDNVPGPVWKVLSEDSASGAVTYLYHSPPGWVDPALGWHPHDEETFVLAPQVPDTSSARFYPGYYAYKQPGILHAPPPFSRSSPFAYQGITFLVRVSGRIQLRRYTGTKFACQAGNYVTDQHVTWPVDPVATNTNAVVLDTAPKEGPWGGIGYTWLHRNKRTGGGAILLDLPAGWRGQPPPPRGVREEFVIEGSLDIDGERFERWGYACREASNAAREYVSEVGSRLLCWWDTNELGPCEAET